MSSTDISSSTLLRSARPPSAPWVAVANVATGASVATGGGPCDLSAPNIEDGHVRAKCPRDSWGPEAGGPTAAACATLAGDSVGAPNIIGVCDRGGTVHR